MPFTNISPRVKNFAIGCFVLVLSIIAIFVSDQLTTDQTKDQTSHAAANVSKDISTNAVEKEESVVRPSAHEEEHSIDVLATESNDLPNVYVPLKTIEPTEEESRFLYEAEELLVKNCMNERGFEYIQNSIDDESSFDTRPEVVKLGDTSAARTQGYGLADSINNPDLTNSGLPSVLQDPNGAIVNGMDPEQQEAWNTALFGEISSDMTSPSATQVSFEDPLNGGIISWDANSCFAIAQAQLYESNSKDVENGFANYKLQEQVYSMADADVEYQTSIGQWQNCMAESGLYFDYPGEAAEQLIEVYRKDEISVEALREQEIRFATVDSACYQRSAVDRAYSAALQRAESILLNDKSETVAGLRQAIRSAVERALAIN